MPQVFISYRRVPSSILADLLELELEKLGFDVFLDVHDIPKIPGSFPEYLSRAIENTDFFVCLLAETTLESEWIDYEVRLAHQLNKSMIPVFQESFNSPSKPYSPYVDALLMSQGVRVFDQKNAYIEEAIKDIALLMGFAGSFEHVSPSSKFIAVPIAPSGFILLTPSFFESIGEKLADVDNMSLFYDGARPSWFDILLNRDVFRDVTEVATNAIKQSGASIAVLEVVASGGAGKSTFLMRLAYILAMGAEVVLFHSRDISTLDSNAVFEFAERIERRRLFIVIDDCGRVSNLDGFISALSERGHNIILVLTSRPFEWSNQRRSYPSNVEVLPSLRSLDELTDNEIRAIIEKLALEGKVRQPDKEKLDQIVTHYANRSKRSALALMLLLTKGEKVADVIRDEIWRLQKAEPLLFSAYRYVCILNAMHSFATRRLLEELCGEKDLAIDVVNKLPGLIEEIGREIVARHDLIAEIVVREVFRGDETALLIAVTNAVNKAVEICETEVIARLDPTLELSEVTP